MLSLYKIKKYVFCDQGLKLYLMLTSLPWALLTGKELRIHVITSTAKPSYNSGVNEQLQSTESNECDYLSVF